MSAFERLNQRQRELAAETGKSPSSTSIPEHAGSLRQIDAAVTSERELSFFCYQLGLVEGGPELNSHTETLAWLGSLDFPINEHTQSSPRSTMSSSASPSSRRCATASTTSSTVWW